MACGRFFEPEYWRPESRPIPRNPRISSIHPVRTQKKCTENVHRETLRLTFHCVSGRDPASDRSSSRPAAWSRHVGAPATSRTLSSAHTHALLPTQPPPGRCATPATLLKQREKVSWSIETWAPGVWRLSAARSVSSVDAARRIQPPTTSISNTLLLSPWVRRQSNRRRWLRCVNQSTRRTLFFSFRFFANNTQGQRRWSDEVPRPKVNIGH